MKKFGLLILFVCVDVALYAQCAMCKSGVASNLEGGGNTGRGINTGILYLMAIPYLLIGGLVVYVYRKELAEKLKRFKSPKLPA
ncbi:MAG: hypothetical protein IPP56_09105 [Bacteroidetes bacterium]|nr:hypothetical protein [Bacteroidota bacterium]MBK9670692.1 hypothetical protein [Bacteroidota bacterium]MBK9799865.1 hypothetical protein [Bacteroidota bacterium]MBP6413249.1 hypothetical protein [Bacteroidia bacterium]